MIKGNNTFGTRKLRGVLLASLSAILFGLAPIFAKFAYAAGSGATTLTLLSFVLALPFLFAVLKQRQIKILPDRKEILLLIMAGATYCASMLLFYIASDKITAASTTTLHYLYPVLVMLAETIFFSHRHKKIRLMSALLNLIGVFCFFEWGGSTNLSGSLFAIGSALCYAAYTILLDHTILKECNVLKLTFLICLFSSVFLFLYGVSSHSLSFQLTWEAWLTAFLLAMTSSVLATIFFQAGIQNAGSTRASLASTLEPLTSIVLGVLLFYEDFPLSSLLGCILISVGVVLNAL